MNRRTDASQRSTAKSHASMNSRWRSVAIAGALCALVAVAFLGWRAYIASPPKNGLRLPASFQLEPEDKAFAQYAGSASCRDCHSEAYHAWKHSHHGLAERPLDPAIDRVAFDPPRLISHGSQTSEARVSGDRCELVTAVSGTNKMAFAPDGVIGVYPLRQFLIPASGGRWQATELAWDPKKREWFNVYGEEDRQPGEWGHWTGRGMTWNSMCATCHNTRLRKNYDPQTDTYTTHMVERGVGCESCHGPMRDHVNWQRQSGRPGRKDPTISRLSRPQMLDTCGACHARRSELTGDFKPGEKFFDHFGLSIPDESDVFYPDGQVRDENFEYAAFLGSRMHHAGVSCMDCHEPHSSKTILQGDLLCMRCHGPPVAPAPRIDPLAHTFHKPGTPGSRCVDCHMPVTTYMERHPRHDHGFTIPDPLLTKKFGIPNACNRCHTEQTADWALEHTHRWYGTNMNQLSRQRTEWVARGRTNEPGAQSELLRVLIEEPLPFWRAVAANLLGNFTYDPAVIPRLLESTRDTNELVRAMAARALDSERDNPEVTRRWSELLDDPVRVVRMEAAWRLRAQIDTNRLAAQELVHSMMLNSDQPTGQLQLGQWHFDRRDMAQALPAFRRAAEWDTNSPPLRHAYAVALNAAGRTEEAVRELEKAIHVAPRDAELRFTLALALNEMGRLDQAVSALEETVRLDPRFGRAWYNLGLAYSALNQPDRAIQALLQAEQADPQSADAPYARATILARLGLEREALEAIESALRINPAHRQAAELRDYLRGRSRR
jgi:tetratricopeptide (TPR) repeat protein